MRNCPKCGKEIDEKAVLCVNCGASVKPKKPIFKKWWVWVIIIIFIIVLGSAFGKNNSAGDTTNQASQNSSVVAQNNSSQEDAKTENSSETQLTYEEEIATYGEIDFETLSRNPDKHKGEKLKFIGKVIQVQEPTFGNTVQLRINVTKETYEYFDDATWTDTIFATVELTDGDDRILEDDIITFYGECKGLYSYTSVLGSKISLPKIEIKYWNFAE